VVVCFAAEKFCWVGLAIRGGVTALSKRGRVSKAETRALAGASSTTGYHNAKREGVWT
jgi:hypothetical protein